MNESTQSKSPKQGMALWKKIVLGIVGAFVVALIGIQFVPVAAMENPPVKVAFDEDPKVKAVLVRACYDCHSHETKWPWYSRIAPVSWLVARDVVEGRKAFNFSDWPADEFDRQFNREGAWEIVEEGEMPPWFYLPAHPEAELTEQDLAILKKWATEKAEDDDE